MDEMQDIALRLKRIQDDILDHYNETRNANNETSSPDTEP
jgi:hypothetical protein